MLLLKYIHNTGALWSSETLPTWYWYLDLSGNHYKSLQLFLAYYQAPQPRRCSPQRQSQDNYIKQTRRKGQKAVCSECEMRKQKASPPSDSPHMAPRPFISAVHRSAPAVKPPIFFLSIASSYEEKWLNVFQLHDCKSLHLPHTWVCEGNRRRWKIGQCRAGAAWCHHGFRLGISVTFIQWLLQC